MDSNFKLGFITQSLAQIGVVGAILIAMLSWLGKIWVARLLEKEKNTFKAEFEEIKHELDVIKETSLSIQSEKMLTYKFLIENISELLATLDTYQKGSLTLQNARKNFDQFNKQRFMIYGYLAMLAPQAVMDAHDNLMDYLLEISNTSTIYDWEKIRDLTICLLNEIRVDVAIDKKPIKYNGYL